MQADAQHTHSHMYSDTYTHIHPYALRHIDTHTQTYRHIYTAHRHICTQTHTALSSEGGREREREREREVSSVVTKVSPLAQRYLPNTEKSENQTGEPRLERGWV